MPRKPAPPQSFAEVVKLWPSRQTLAADMGLSYYTVASWVHRDSIDIRHWGPLLEAARARGIRLSNAQLHKLLLSRWSGSPRSPTEQPTAGAA